MADTLPLLAAARLLCFIAAIHLVSCNDNQPKEDIIPFTYKPTWTYRCVPDEGCQRTDSPRPINDVNVTRNSFSSLDVCRTVCGRFGGLWPKPVTAVLSTQTVKIHPNSLRFDLVDVPVEIRELLVQMTQLVGPNLAKECGDVAMELVNTPIIVYISIKSALLTLDLNTDEQYMLDVHSKGDQIAVHIVAETVYGARHALETFSQLVAPEKLDNMSRRTCNLHLVSGAKIRDRPVFKYRGFLQDTSRHFIPMKDLKRTIDGMAANKMNVFHWHVTDSHSFPLESTRVPQFTKYGAYSPEELYSTEEVREFVQYARVRGVRVIIEIDSPAHAGNGWQWGKEHGLGDLAVCVNAQPWRPNCIEPPCGQLNPANNAMYRVLGDLYRDIAELISSPPLLHMGGDEVLFECWKNTKEITDYMKKQGYDVNSTEGYMKLWAEFHDRALGTWDEILKSIGSAGQPVMLWSSALTQYNIIQSYLSKDRYIIEVWEPLSSPLLQQLIRLGYRTVSVPKDIWYLDHGFWGSTKYSNWRRMYAHNLPTNAEMLGGEVAMWSEYMDENVLDTRVWPRTAAVAERLWSNPSTSAYDAEPRLQRMRDRLIARGLRPDAISPGWCSQHDSKCL